MITTLYVHPNLPTALVAERAGAYYVVGAPWSRAWAQRRPIPAPITSLERVLLHPNSPLITCSDIPSVLTTPAHGGEAHAG